MELQCQQLTQRIAELERVQSGHNISAMLCICKPETREKVAVIVERAFKAIGHPFNVE